jgi:4-amino-4-deoxy-L-arabinose transferase-like glycosyltransferase
VKYTKNALLVFVLLAFMYGYFYQNPQANGNSRIGLIFAMVQQRRLTIDSYYDKEGTSTIDIAFINGHYYSDKAIGTSVVGVLFYAPMYLFMKLTGYQLDLIDIKYILTVLVIGLPSAFAGSLVYILCETISRSRLRAYLATLAIALGTMALPFSAIFFGHQLAAVFLFCGFFLTFQLKLKRNLLQKQGYLFLIGFLLGMAFITEYPTAVIIFPLFIYYLFVLQERWSFHWLRSAIMPYLLGAFIPVAILMVYNTLCFGNPFSIGYQHLANQYQGSMSQGLMGINLPRLDVLFYLTFHPAQGLFWQSPVLLMSMVGFFFLWRDKNYRLETIVIMVAFIAILLVNAGYYMWWGGYSFGPRHLIPILLFLSIPLSMLPKRLIPLVIILTIISVGQMLIPLAGNMLAPDDYFVQGGYTRFFGYSTIYSFSLQQLLQGYFAYNLGEKLLGLKKWMILLPNILAILLTTGIFIAKEKRLPRSTLSIVE